MGVQDPEAPVRGNCVHKLLWIWGQELGIYTPASSLRRSLEGGSSTPPLGSGGSRLFPSVLCTASGTA